MNLVELIPLVALVAFVVLAIWRRNEPIIFAVVPMITASEVSQRIAEVIRSIVMAVFEIATPIVNVLGIAQIILGLLLWFGARQEFLGWRLVAAGIIMLIFVHVIAPFLLSFI